MIGRPVTGVLFPKVSLSGPVFSDRLDDKLREALGGELVVLV